MSFRMDFDWTAFFSGGQDDMNELSHIILTLKCKKVFRINSFQTGQIITFNILEEHLLYLPLDIQMRSFKTVFGSGLPNLAPQDKFFVSLFSADSGFCSL